MTDTPDKPGKQPKGLSQIVLRGKSQECFERVFDQISELLIKCLDEATTSVKPTTRKRVKRAAEDALEISKEYIRSRLENPRLQNEKLAAEVIAIYQQARLTELQCEKEAVAIEQAKLDLSEAKLNHLMSRIQQLLKFMEFRHSLVSKDREGNLTITLTNDKLLPEGTFRQDEVAESDEESHGTKSSPVTD